MRKSSLEIPSTPTNQVGLLSAQASENKGSQTRNDVINAQFYNTSHQRGHNTSEATASCSASSTGHSTHNFACDLLKTQKEEAEDIIMISPKLIQP